MIKRCKKCKIDKNIDEFYHHRCTCKKCCNLESKEYRLKNMEKSKIQSHDRYLKNKSRRRGPRNTYAKERRKSDPLFAISSSIRRLIRLSISRNGYSKSEKTVNIIGCSFEEFKLYLESKFESWMTWENRGLYNGEFSFGWDVDHIIPVSSGKSEEEIIKLNHYTNLQPLCSKINRDIKKDN